MWPLPVMLRLEATQTFPLTFDFGDVAEPVLSRRGIALHRVLGIRFAGIAMLLGQLFESNRDESCVTVRPADLPVPLATRTARTDKGLHANTSFLPPGCSSWCSFSFQRFKNE